MNMVKDFENAASEKKEYVAPQMKIVEMKAASCLLGASDAGYSGDDEEDFELN